MATETGFIQFAEGSAPSTPASTKWRLYFKTDGVYVIDDAGTETGPLAEASAAAAPNCYENFLTSAVTMVNADTWYAGPAVTPAAGTYLVVASLVLTSSFNGSTGMITRIHDGTTAYANGQDYVAAQGQVITITRFARVTVTGSETITASASCARGSSVGSILDTVTLTGSTADKASSIVATKITSV